MWLSGGGVSEGRLLQQVHLFVEMKTGTLIYLPSCTILPPPPQKKAHHLPS